MSSTKLLLLTTEFPPQPGGIGNHAHNVAKSLLPHDFEVTVLTNQRSINGIEETSFDSLQSYDVCRIQRKKILVKTYVQRMRKAMTLIKQHDVVLVSGKFSLWMAGFLRFFSKNPIIAVVHGTEVALPSGMKKRFTRWCLLRCTKVIAVSNYTKSLMKDWGLKQIHVIQNGFSMDVRDFQQQKISDGIRLITVGNVTQRKGQHNVIKALPKLLERFPKLQYDIVGIPSEKEKLQALAKRLDVESAVMFHGKVSEEKKIQLLQQANIFVMLSETTAAGDVEGFGIAILEANALGIPAVGALHCGIEDAIDDYKSGILVNHDNPDEIVNAISAILRTYDAYSKMAISWSTHFAWDQVIKKYCTVLSA